jgi:hypothetical protein
VIIGDYISTKKNTLTWTVEKQQGEGVIVYLPATTILQKSLSALETYSDIWIFKKACLLLVLKLTVTFGSSKKLVCS